MRSKYYLLAGQRIRIDSDSPVGDSALYVPFYTDPGDCDLHIRIKEGALPVCGDVPESSCRERKYLRDGERLRMYSFFARESGDVAYACRESSGNEINLYIDYPGGLWDSMVFNALNIPEILALRGIYLCHSSFVVFRDSALIFSAGKGEGKSTQAALWEKETGAGTVNGDRSLLYFSEGVLTAAGTPYCGSSRIALQRSAPVKAVVLLSKGGANEINLCKGTAAVIPLLSQLTFAYYQSREAADFALKVCEAVPVYTMSCLPDASAVSALEAVLWEK